MSELVTSLLNHAADSLKSDWQALVTLALQLPNSQCDEAARSLSMRSKVGFDSVRRKLLAIQYASNNLGYTETEISEHGQEATLSRYQKEKRADKYVEQTWLRYKVSGSIRELFQQQVIRVAQVCDLPNAEAVFEWLIAQLRTSTDEELRHSVGESRAVSEAYPGQTKGQSGR